MAVGVIVGLLCAPVKGEETRRRLYRKVHDVAQAPKRQMADPVEENKQKASELGARLGRDAIESAVEGLAKEKREDDLNPWVLICGRAKSIRVFSPAGIILLLRHQGASNSTLDRLL